MIFTRFGFSSVWPAHKNVPLFKKCFFNLLSLKTGSKIISLLWVLLFSVRFGMELRTALDDNTSEQIKIRCLFNQTQLCPTTPAGEDSSEVFLYGYYNLVVNQSQGSVTSLTKIDDGIYEWDIFCTCLFYSMLILSSALLYCGILYDKAPVLLSWLGVTQMILLIEVCMVVFDFVFLVLNDQYLEHLSFLFLLHLGFVVFILYSLLIINSYTVLVIENAASINRMVG